jgi:hypothetical protein
MIDVDVGDERTTSSLSRATDTLLNHSEAKVFQWRQANYANNDHSTNDNDNANANDNDNDNANANANGNGNGNANANDNDNAHLTFTSLRFCRRPGVTASPVTRVTDRTELKDCSEPPACRSSRPQPKKKKGGGGERERIA